MQTETEMQVSVRAPAKINLTFDVTGDLPDGYHSIVSLFHAITLDDILSVSVQPGACDQLALDMTAELVGEPGVFPLDENNLIARAAKAFQKKTDLLTGSLLRISVKKQIPIGAGLAGGSSNAAAMLVALNSLFSSPLNETELCELAITLGADVPFLIRGGMQLGEGKGEILTAIPFAERLTVVVVKPRQLSVFTPAVFSEYDKWVKEKTSAWRPLIDHQGAINALLDGDLETAARSFGNVFEPIVFDRHPALASIKNRLLEIGSWSAQLSGSGPSIFAVAANLEMAHAIRDQLREDANRGNTVKPGWELDCYIAESAGCGVEIQA